jgi:hypothetical protein
MLAGLIGVALDLLDRPPYIGRLAIILFPAICLAWFSLRPLLAHPDVGLLIKLALMWAGAPIVLWQICIATARGGALAGTILILATAVGAAGVAALAPFIGVTLLCASIAAVAGASSLWAYGARVLVGAPMTIGATSLLGAAGGLVATVLLLVLFTASVSTAGAALLITVPFAGLIWSARLWASPPDHGRGGPRSRRDRTGLPHARPMTRRVLYQPQMEETHVCGERGIAR